MDEINTQHLIIWEEILCLVCVGETYLVAIDQIYKAYGPTLPVRTIIKRIRQDRKTGGHPALRSDSSVYCLHLSI